MTPLAYAHGLAFRHAGPTGEPLLLLTGIMGDGRRLSRLVRDLGADRRVLLIDPIGGGSSEVPADPLAYRWDEQVARLLRLLDEQHIGARSPIDVLGLSLGGMWAQQLHLRAPGRIRRLVLASSCVRPEPRLRAMVLGLRAQVEAGLPPLALARSLLVLLFSPPFLDRAGAVPLIEGMLSESPPPREGLLGQLGAILEHDATGRLAGLSARVIAGELDWLTPPGDQQRLCAELGGADLTLLPQAGHCLWIEQPEGFAQAVRDALAELP